MQIGVLGGSFDPIHQGHTGVARAVADALGLERVLLLPAAQAPLRDSVARASGAQRAEMVRLAVQELSELDRERRLEACDIDLRRGGVSYTVDTLRALRAERPADTFTWIIGADQLARLASWREPEELARLARWAAYTRPGYAWEAVDAAPAIPGLRITRVKPPHGAVWTHSSSEIRARLARGESVAGLLSDKVIEYIRENGLYGI